MMRLIEQVYKSAKKYFEQINYKSGTLTKLYTLSENDNNLKIGEWG